MKLPRVLLLSTATTGFVLAIAFLLGQTGGSAFAIAGSSPTPTPPPMPPPFVLPSGSARITQPTALRGVPAIAPRSSVVPSFSAADAQDYARRVPHPFRDPTRGLPTLQSISFLSAATVAKQFGAATGLPDTALLCVITENGTFKVRGAPGTHPITGTTGIRILDAQTGNLLVMQTY